MKTSKKFKNPNPGRPMGPKIKIKLVHIENIDNLSKLSSIDEVAYLPILLTSSPEELTSVDKLLWL